MILKEKLNKMTIEEIEEKIEYRLKLIKQLVGQLYPSILWDEISQLRERQAELCRKKL